MRMSVSTSPATTVLALALAMALAGCGRSEAPPAQPASESAAAGVDTAAHPDAHRFAIGQLEAVVLKDGDIQVPNDGTVIAIGQPGEETDALLQAAGQPTDTLHLSVQSLLVRGGDRTILFDAGAGQVEFVIDGGRLPQSLRAAGVEPEDVTDIFISHGHGDHVGGLVDADGDLVFPNATVRLSAPEWQALQGGEDALLAQAIAARVEAFEPGSEEILPGVSAVPVDGHTPGHSAYEIASDGERLLYIGDSAHHHVISVQRPGWTIAFDGDAPLAEDSREALLARLADEALTIASPHFPFPGLGRIERRDGDFVWVPLE